MHYFKKVFLISPICMLMGLFGLGTLSADPSRMDSLNDDELIAHKGGGHHGGHHGHHHGHHGHPHHHHHWHHHHHSPWWHHRHHPRHWHHHGRPWHNYRHDWYWYGGGAWGANPGYYYDPSFYYDYEGLPSVEYEYDIPPEVPPTNVEIPINIQNQPLYNEVQPGEDEGEYENSVGEPTAPNPPVKQN